jgi:hypothetical protein
MGLSVEILTCTCVVHITMVNFTVENNTAVLYYSERGKIRT